MKKLILLSFMLFSFVCMSQQDKKLTREITFSTSSGLNIDKDYFNQTSTNIYYELSKKTYLKSWTGIGYRQNRGSWFSTVNTINRKLTDKLELGTGLLFISGDQNSFISSPVLKEETFLILSLSYKIKL